MAFATANVRKGTAGDIKITAGDWTGTVGDASGTIVVEGGRVYSCQFNTNDTVGPVQSDMPFTVSTSGALTTITIHNRETVTAGTFIIHHA